MPTYLGLFYALRWGNHVYSTFMLIFCCYCFLNVLYFLYTIQSNTNNFQIDLLKPFPVFRGLKPHYQVQYNFIPKTPFFEGVLLLWRRYSRRMFTPTNRTLNKWCAITWEKKQLSFLYSDWKRWWLFGHGNIEDRLLPRQEVSSLPNFWPSSSYQIIDIKQ